MDNPEPGSLSWRLSSHPLTLIFFLAFRIGTRTLSPLITVLLTILGSLLTYLFGVFFTENYVLIFIITMLLLAVDFYNIKNIAGRRLVGLRWWNEVNPQSGDTTMVFESLPQDASDPAYRSVNATDKRFFWLALYVQPVLWVLLAVTAILRVKLIWLSLVGEYNLNSALRFKTDKTH